MGVGREDPDLKYKMMYCDNALCRVNTFEYGWWGDCPACGSEGKEL